MSRVLKFRAWTGKTMMYQEKQYLASFIRRVVLQVNLDNENGFQQAHESYLPNGGDISEYLMQYTGLNDRKGVEIYEGDLIHRPDIGIAMLVRWNEKNAGFDLAMKDPNNFDAVTLWYTQAAHTDYEVIGNIYEHPERFVKYT